MPYEQQKKSLASVIKTLYETHKQKIESLKVPHADMARPDFVWHYLLQSFSTMGRAAGWHGLIGNQANYSRITFSALEQLTGAKRRAVVEQTCRDAKIRMPGIKAGFILRCFDQITAFGGLAAVKAALFATPGRNGKIKFLRQFHGIGPKYARNMMMDVYQEDFRESIAIDSRIQSISTALGVAFNNYANHENFYLDVAHLAGMNGWELDRLMFNFHREVLAAIDAGKG
jgi:hypothetical protein